VVSALVNAFIPTPPARAPLSSDLVWFGVLGGGLVGALERFLECGEFRGVGSADAAALGGERGVRGIGRVERFLLRLVVLCADLGGALERHVFEHVREAGDARELPERNPHRRV